MMIENDEGLRISSRKGWIYIGLMTDLYVFHIEIGRFIVSFERKIK